PAQAVNLVGLYGLPALHASFGALGGLLGQIIWRPVPLSGVPVALSPNRKPAQRRKKPLFAGPIAWFRVLAGSAFNIAGTLSATMILDKVSEVSHGKLGPTSDLQDQLITWELKALALLVGGALAGATTTNGLKQGLVVA